MDLALDEASLVPCKRMPPFERLQRLADTLKALDELGVPRVLRSVRDAVDRDIAGGRGLRQWCFDRQTPRDAGLLIAQRLAKAPYLDGLGGLFATVEAERAIQPTICGNCSVGGGYVALTDSVLVIFAGSTWPPERPVVVCLVVLAEDEERIDHVSIDAVDCKEDVATLAEPIARRIESAISTGVDLVARLPELCPRLDLGARAAEQLVELNGSEPYFPQVLRHLRALNRTADRWVPGTPFTPEGLSFSVEAEATLVHGTLGPMRDFPVPTAFPKARWTLHTKLTGGNGARLYYMIREVNEVQQDGVTVRRLRLAIGYVGPHLPTVKFR